MPSSSENFLAKKFNVYWQARHGQGFVKQLYDKTSKLGIGFIGRFSIKSVLSVFFPIGGSTGVHRRVRSHTNGPELPYKARRVGVGGGKVASNSW